MYVEACIAQCFGLVSTPIMFVCADHFASRRAPQLGSEPHAPHAVLLSSPTEAMQGMNRPTDLFCQN
jgi:hypothetical protein